MGKKGFLNKMKKLKCWKVHKDESGEIYSISRLKKNKSKIAGYSITDADFGLSVYANEFHNDSGLKSKKFDSEKRDKAVKQIINWAKKKDKC